MSPLDRRRRRRRPILPAVVVALAVAIVLFVLIGGVFEVGPVSGNYRRDVNRSYVAQGAVLVGQSNQTGAQLRSLMGSMPTLQRTALQRQLDGLASSSAQVAASVDTLSPPPPTVDGLAASLAARAKGVAEVRAAVDGFLGLGGGSRPLLPADRTGRRSSPGPGRCWPGPTGPTRRCAGPSGPLRAAPGCRGPPG